MKAGWFGLALGWVAVAITPACADIIPPKALVTTPYGVNVADGSLQYSVTDLTIGPLVLQRFTVSAALPIDAPAFGPGMTSNYDIYVAPNFTRRTPPPLPVPAHYLPIVHLGASVSGVFRQPYPQAAPVQAWNKDAFVGELDWVSGAYVYTDSTGAIYTFTPAVTAGGSMDTGSQRVATIAFADGRTQTFSYNAGGKLKLVSDSSGYAIVFDYGANGNVSAACGFDLSQTYVTATSTCTGATLKTSYTYSGTSLTTATDVFGQVTTYGTAMSCIQPPGYSTCKIATTGTQQTLADGEVWKFSPSGPATDINDPLYLASDCDGAASMTDPALKVTNYAFTKSSPCSIIDANGHTTSYHWSGGTLMDDPGAPMNEGTLLMDATMPEGNKYLAEYNGPFNTVTKQTMQAKPGSGLADQVETRTYSQSGALPTWAKPVTTVDANGNTTNYDYYSFGGIKSQVQPAPASGAARPLKLYDYVQKYAYVKNAGGTLVPAAAPIWVANSETDCQTVAGSSSAVCDSGAPQVVTTYQYGANGTADNLLLRGKAVTSGGVTLRTCYGYDAQSNKISETSPRAGLSICP